MATPWVQSKGLETQLARLNCRIASITMAVVVVLEDGQQLGIPLVKLLAGVRVSGLVAAPAFLHVERRGNFGSCVQLVIQ